MSDDADDYIRIGADAFTQPVKAPTPEITHEELAEHIQQFLANGGQITEIPTGVTKIGTGHVPSEFEAARLRANKRKARKRALEKKDDPLSSSQSGSP